MIFCASVNKDQKAPLSLPQVSQVLYLSYANANSTLVAIVYFSHVRLCEENFWGQQTCQTGPTQPFYVLYFLLYSVSASSPPTEAFKGEQCDFLQGDTAHSGPHLGEPQPPSMHLSRHVSHTAWWPSTMQVRFWKPFLGFCGLIVQKQHFIS